MEALKAFDNSAFYFHKSINTTSSQCTRHYHDSFEIYFLKSGSCNYFIDNALYSVSPGDIVLIPAGVIHKTNYDSTPHTRLLINCSPSYIPECVKNEIPNMIYIYKNQAVQKEAESIIEKIGKNYESSDIYREEAILHLMAEFFILLARNTNKLVRVSSGSRIIENAVSYLQEHYMTEISLSEVAKLNLVSPEHLSRSFKKETGLGFSEYLNLLRLQKAEYKLKNEPGKSISEIAYACGFNDSNYFSDKFKKAYGVTPSAMKSKLLKKV